MRVLVTGAQGFIGRYLVADWLAADDDVEIVGVGRSARVDDRFTHDVTWGADTVAAPLPPALAAVATDPRYQYAAVDLLDTPALTRLVEHTRPDVVVHLAAALRDEPPERLVRTNVGAVVSLLEAVVGAAVPAPRVVLGSSGSVYGAVAGRPLPLTEDMQCAPLDPYSVSKRAAEDMSRILAERHDLDVAWARIFNPVGPGQDERHLCGWLGRQVAAIRAGLIEPEVAVGPLHTTRDYIDVRDTASALRVLATSHRTGVVNVASGDETSGEDVLAALLARLGGREVRRQELAGRPSDMERHFADVAVLRGLGWTPAFPLADSLADVVAYYEDEVGPLTADGAVPASASDGSALFLRADRVARCAVEVRAGLLDDLPEILATRFGRPRMVVLTDSGVADLYARPLVDALGATSVDATLVVVPEGEGSKSLVCFEQVIGAMHEARFDRRSLLVNVGGGMITDLGGYAAASYMRSVAYVNVPTTLLAQHDSGIGGKVAVNAPWAKNFVGAFHHPEAVYCDPLVLGTLDGRDLRCGVSESLKVALCGAPGLFELLEQRRAEVLAAEPAVVEEVVRRSAAHKLALLAPDPYEVDLRRALNLGHTLGHALESELAYGDVLHGEAVALGVAVATEMAMERGRCSRADGERILALIRDYGLVPPVPMDRVVASADRIDDIRLIRGGSLNYVLPTGLRSVEIVPDLPVAEVVAAARSLADRDALGAGVLVG
ncbi:MAG: iron-containing alcohol dehydrogenase [Microthrixaceae bacterium]